MKTIRSLVKVIAIVGILFITFNLFVRKIWFFRDPVRVADETGNVIIAACDGQVVYVKKIEGDEIYSEKLGAKIPLKEISKMDLKEPVNGWLIGVYMSPLDVHYNYAPIDGRIRDMIHTQTKLNLPMVDLWEYIQITYLRQVVDLFGKKYHLENERNTVYIEGKDIDIIAVEIADKFVNKISTFAGIGDEVRTGQKISFIERGSQVDMIILQENGVEFNVEIGDQVYGGQTVLARYKTEKGKLP